jgi:putative transposase
VPNPESVVGLRYASRRYWGQITKALRVIYTAATIEAAEKAFAQFEAEWGGKYPAIITLWRSSCDQGQASQPSPHHR